VGAKKTLRKLYGDDLVDQVCRLDLHESKYGGSSSSVSFMIPGGDDLGYCVIGALHFFAARRNEMPVHVTRMPSPEVAYKHASRVLGKQLTRRDRELIREAIDINDAHARDVDEYVAHVKGELLQGCDV